VADEDKVALVIATFYEDLAAKLEDGAREALDEAGFNEVDKFEVPGAFELPLIARYAADTGLAQVQLLSGIPIGFGLLTVDNMDQALARVKGGNKRDSAAHAVEAALASLTIKRSLSERPRRAGFAG